jgi:hypothetical protein
MELLIDAADALDLAGGACERPEDAEHFFALSARLRRYLALSRPTTTLGMRRIPSSEVRLTEENVIHRTGVVEQSHLRVLRD